MLPAPNEVVVIAIDNEQSKQPRVEYDTSQLTHRQEHADLINKLASAGAAAIVFDVFYKDVKDPAQDLALVDAIKNAGNVALVSTLHRELLGAQNNETAIIVDQLVPPAPLFANAAWAVAPFVLPKVPARINQFWSFHESFTESPMLPVRALELFNKPSLPALGTIITSLDLGDAATLGQALMEPRISTATFTKLQHFIRNNPGSTHDLNQAISQNAALPAEAKEHLFALLDTYRQGGRYYLNLFGPPHSITTISLSEALKEQATLDVAGKAVFVGLSEKLQPRQRDSYYTVYTGKSGADISGVEIAATAFSNLLNRNPITPLTAKPYLTLIIAFSLLTAILALSLPAMLAILSIATLSALYIYFAAYLFNTYALWLPLVIPLLLQMPLTLFAALVWRYHLSNRERKRIRQAFGYYLPDNVVNDLARQGSHVTISSQEMFGICLATDAQGYTQLAEKLDPKTLSLLMNQYYETLFTPVRAHGGVISDVVGDAMLAIWPAKKPDATLRFKACKAALEIARAVDAFNNLSTQPKFRTRIGLHAGQLTLGNIGALDHFEYRAVGDIVNTATRIESLNKKLGSTILVSEEIIAGLNGFVTRKLGTFRLAGKQQSIVIHELLAFEHERTPVLTDLCNLFAAAQAVYDTQHWSKAAELFSALLIKYPGDMPSTFYRQLACQHHATPSEPDSHVITIADK